MKPFDLSITIQTKYKTLSTGTLYLDSDNLLEAHTGGIGNINAKARIILKTDEPNRFYRYYCESTKSNDKGIKVTFGIKNNTLCITDYHLWYTNNRGVCTSLFPEDSVEGVVITCSREITLAFKKQEDYLGRVPLSSVNGFADEYKGNIRVEVIP